MPAKSKAQQRLFGMVHAYQKGRMKDAPASVKRIAKHISKTDAKHFAETKHDGLPEKKDKEMKKSAYTKGFFTKCAEHGLPYEMAVALFKRAAGVLPKYESYPSDPQVVDGVNVHEVKPGDTISGIMQNQGIPQNYLPEVLKSLNLTEQTAKRIKPGQAVHLYEDPTAYEDMRAAARAKKAPTAVNPAPIEPTPTSFGTTTRRTP